MKNVPAILEYYAQNVTGTLGIGYKNLKTGEEYFVRGDVRFPSASVFKVPVLIELFAQVEAGKIKLTDMHTLTESDLSVGSGVLAVLNPGLTMSVLDYATLMMILSDNTATDVIFRLLGRENIRARIDALGLKDTRCDLNCRELVLGLYNMPLDMTVAEAREHFKTEGRKLDRKYYVTMESPNDYSTPRDMARIFDMLHKGEVVSPAASANMLSIMERCQTNSRIPYHLPGEGGMRADVMHKTGTLRYVANDCGIVRTASQAYILTMFYNGIDAAEHEQQLGHFPDTLLANISKEVFEAVHGCLI